MLSNFSNIFVAYSYFIREFPLKLVNARLKDLIYNYICTTN